MFIIKEEQIRHFDNHFKDKFIKAILGKYPTSTFRQIHLIVDEALGFEITSESLVSRYVELYLLNKELFISKPLWVKNVLTGGYYIAEDKVSYLENTLNHEK